MNGLKIKPTESELQILNVLWDLGPSTVAAIHEKLHPENQTGYTTTLKFLQIMLEKGLVTRDDSKRQHVYSAASSKTSIRKHLVRDLVDKAFEGSAHTLVMHALTMKKASPEELREIRRLLEDMEEHQ